MVWTSVVMSKQCPPMVNHSQKSFFPYKKHSLQSLVSVLWISNFWYNMLLSKETSMLNSRIFQKYAVSNTCYTCACFYLAIILSFVFNRCFYVLSELWKWLCCPSWCLFLGWWLLRARAQATTDIIIFHWWWNLHCKRKV